MTTVLLYWNHICVLHKGEKQFLDRLAERLSNEDIDLRVRYFGLGYPEHMSEYLARPDAILPDLIVSADLEVFEDSRIYRKLEKGLYPVTKWIPLRDGGALDAVRRDDRLLPFVSIPLVYYTRQPDICERTALKDWDGLAFGGINNSAAKTVVKAVWNRWGRRAACGLLERSNIADMPIGAFQAVRMSQSQTALVPSIYALRADGRETFLRIPQGGACAGAIILLRPHLRTGTSSPPGGREHSVSRAVPVLCGAGGPDPLPGLSGHT
ncbi:MAG: hypothetical protein ACLUN5_02145 [Oscillospiraceae bacterium]